MYKRILIANRGEIALRIMRACKEMGIETIAIFSEGDRGAAYLDLADEAYCVAVHPVSLATMCGSCVLFYLNRRGLDNLKWPLKK